MQMWLPDGEHHIMYEALQVPPHIVTYEYDMKAAELKEFKFEFDKNVL